MESPQVSFRCNFCFVTIPRNKAKKCGACKRRVYCNIECQKNDWRQQPDSEHGECHRYWCKQSCGEEGVDWEIRYISPSKGKGMFALRTFEKYEIIIAEEFLTTDLMDSQGPLNSRSGVKVNPGKIKMIEDLEPIGGSLSDKVSLNMLGTADISRTGGLCIRISRVNHDCAPNAYHIFHKKRNTDYGDTKTLRVAKQIDRGEEITISYVNFSSDKYT